MGLREKIEAAFPEDQIEDGCLAALGYPYFMVRTAAELLALKCYLEKNRERTVR